MRAHHHQVDILAVGHLGDFLGRAADHVAGDGVDPGLGESDRGGLECLFRFVLVVAGDNFLAHHAGGALRHRHLDVEQFDMGFGADQGGAAGDEVNRVGAVRTAVDGDEDLHEERSWVEL